MQLETDRLILRPLTHADADGLFELDSNPNVHRYLGNQPVTSMEQITTVLENIQSQYRQNGIGRYAVILKESGEFVGWAGLKFITEPENGHVNFYDIGYRLIERFWRKGYGLEAATAWRNHAFEVIKPEKIYASAHVENIGSRTILEKIGLKTTATYDHHDLPCVWMEMSRNDYHQK